MANLLGTTLYTIEVTIPEDAITFYENIQEVFNVLDFQKVSTLNSANGLRLLLWIGEAMTQRSAELSLGVGWIRQKLCLEGKQKAWSNFKQVAIERPLIGINLSIKTLYKREGRRIERVVFKLPFKP